MFRQLVNQPGNPNQTLTNVNSLFAYHPLQIGAIAETVWLNRNTAQNSQTFNSPFLPWSPKLAYEILSAPFFPGYNWASPTHPKPLLPGDPAVQTPTYTPPLNQPGITNTWDGTTIPIPSPPLGTPPHRTNWDHLIYAYVIENTRIFEIFTKVVETYMYSEELGPPSPQSQLFLNILEFLIFGGAIPSMVWTTSSRLRRDEQANRLTAYYWMFGADLSHAPALATEHRYQKPAASNRDFIPTFETFGREVWRGIVNARNVSGANDTDPSVISTLARRLYDMMTSRRINGNLSREEFRAVAVMSFLHLAVLYDSPVVVDLRAQASSPEIRLQNIADRVGMTAHPKSKPLFDLAAPFSVLMQQIETGEFNTPDKAADLYLQVPAPNRISQNAEWVIDQYTLATGRDLKALPSSVVSRATTSQMPPPQLQIPAGQLKAPRVNGHARPGQ
jgi:hypothetical protein